MFFFFFVFLHQTNLGPFLSLSLTYFSKQPHTQNILISTVFYPKKKPQNLALGTCFSRETELVLMSSSDKKPIIFLFLLSLLFIGSPSLKSSATKPNAEITVMGLVYCDICSNNSFSRHSYFMPAVEVKIDCQFKAASPRTREQIAFSVNRTTNKLGLYKLGIPSVDGLACSEAAMASSCQASLIGSSSASCDVPGYRTTTDQIVFKSKRSNVCIYGLNALNFRPSERNLALCG